MANRKDSIIAVLATFCLTSALFMIIPTKSQSSTAAIGAYDPWVDMNDDGTINFLDAILLGGAFGTSGDPTKNVTITNWPPKWRIQGFENINFTWENYGGIQGHPIMEGFTEGYSRMSVQIIVENCSEGYGWTSVWTDSLIWLIEKPTGSFGVPCDPIYDLVNVTFLMGSETIWDKFTDISGMNEVRAPYYQLQLQFRTEVERGWLLLSVYVYLRNE